MIFHQVFVEIRTAFKRTCYGYYVFFLRCRRQILQRNIKYFQEEVLPGHCSLFFPTWQVRVVRFYLSRLLLLVFLLLRLLRLHSEQPRPVFPAGPQPRAATSGAVGPLRPVFLARPQPRPSAASVLCQTSTVTLCGQCSLPDLNRDHRRPVFPAGPQPRPSALRVPCRTSTAR